MVSKSFQNKLIISVNFLISSYFAVLFGVLAKKIQLGSLENIIAYMIVPCALILLVLILQAFVSFFTFKKRSALHLISCTTLIITAFFVLRSLLY